MPFAAEAAVRTHAEGTVLALGNAEGTRVSPRTTAGRKLRERKLALKPKAPTKRLTLLDGVP